MRKLLLLISMIWLLSPVIHASYNEDDGVFYVKNSDGTEDYTVSGSVTVKTNSSLSYSYKDGAVCLYPSKEGEVIVATFQSLNLPNSCGVVIYDHNFEAVKEKVGKYGAGTGTYKYLPDGWSYELIPGSACETYTSQSDNGAMMIAFHASSWTTGTNGFVVNVQSVVPKAMEYKSSSFVAASTLTRGARNATLGTLTITTEGLSSPLNLMEISAGVSALEAQGVSNIRLCSTKTPTAESILASASDGQLDFMTETALSSGDNKFYLTGDIPADFTGELAAVSNIAVAIDDDTYNVAAEGSTTVENVILMPEGPIVFTIDEDTPFYDDGGIDGKIGSNFNGTVTFVPADPTKKLRIDFSKLAIFYNSSAVSVGNQDVFKFYNGRSADEANLIATLTDETEMIKSTADDGSLTVTLSSKTGYPADGWEAVVSQFLPGNMTVKEVTSLEYPLESVSAYDTDKLATIVNVKTDNAIAPLSLSDINLTVTNSDIFDGFSVYSLGRKNVLSTDNKLNSSYQLNDGNLSIAVEDAELAEGDNYFAVMFDVVKTASNGDKLSITPASVKVGEESYQIPDVATVETSVVNAFYHHVGTDTRDIHDVWQFNSTEDPVSSGKHLLSDKDCIVTFVPNDGAKCVLDFSEFDLYYANSSYSTRAKFEVYSGKTADAENLIWKLAEYNGKPSGALKSTADDGSITVVFNANTTSSYYARSGWKATVNPFVNHDMTVESVTVEQSSTAVIMPGAVAEGILNLEVKTEGSLDSRKLTGVTVDLKSCRESVSRVSVLSVDDEENTAEIGAVDVADDDEVNIPCEFTLTEGANNLRIAYDIKADAEADAMIDAKVVKITTDAGDFTVENGDPEGQRTVKYQYLMSDGDHVVTVTQPIHFYDDGGADDILSKSGLNGTVVFQPADATKKIRVTVVSYATAATGIVDFYSGRAKSDVSLGQCKQNTYPALPMVSQAEDGAMFVNVSCQSYSYGTYNGWDMIVEQYEPGPLHIEGVTAASVADAKTVRGAEDALMTKLTASIDGDVDPVGIRKVNAAVTATELSDVKDVKLWYTVKNDGFAPTCLLATAVPAADGSVKLVVSEPSLSSELGDYYYWLTASLSQEAAADNTITLTVTDVEATDDAVIEVTNKEPQTTTVKSGFAGGEYVIGSSADADYATFAAAMAAMDGAIEGPVKFLIEPGTYAEDVNINEIKGTSETNTLTFTSQSGNADDVIITGKGYVDGGYGAAKYGVVTITNTDWVTLDHLSVIGKVSGSTTYPYYIDLVGHSRHNTVSNCTLEAETATGYSGINLIYCSFPQGVEAAGYNPDFLTIKDNSFKGSYVAVYLQGSQGYVKYPHMKGLTVTGNKFTDVGSKCVYPYQVEDIVIADNEMTAGAAVTKTSYYAIDAVRIKGVVDIYNNKIVNNQTVYSGGIEIRGESTGSEERPIRVYNNTIAITASPSTSSSAIEINSDCNYIELAHNSINVEGSAGYALRLGNNYDGYKGLKLVNNAMRVNSTGTSDYNYAIFLGKEALLPRISFANNAIYSSKKIANFAYESEDWKTSTGDESLICEEPKFVTLSDLHLSESGSLVAGIPVDYVTVDADGVDRAEVPTIGAYEFKALSEDKPVIAEGYPTVSAITYNAARFTSKWNMSGNLHYSALKADDEAPDADTLLEAASREAVADTELSVSLAALEQQTDYKVYMMLEGANGQNSDIVVAEFTTLRYIEPLEVMLESEWDDADAGEDVEIIPGVSGGDEPYTYVWTNRMGEVVGEDETLVLNASNSEIYTLKVTSADGQTGTAFTSLKVYGSTGEATFEDNYLEPDSYWCGTDDADVTNYHFFSGAFCFSNLYMPRYNAWGGFAYSNSTANSFVQLFPDQFNNVVGRGYNSDTYAVLYTMGGPCNIEVLNDRDGVQLDCVYVTNSAYTAHNILVGDSYSAAFSEGDYYMITFTGDDEDGVPVEVYLADYRDGKTDFVDNWKKVDLAPLGKHVKNIKVTSQASNYYVPTYAVLDNLSYKTGSNGVETVDFDNDFNLSDVVRARVIGTDGTVKLTIAAPQQMVGVTELRALPYGVYMIEYMLNDGRVVIRKVVK